MTRTVNTVRPETREAWLEHRRGTVGASEVGALFQVHDYLSPFKLASRKLGLYEDEEETSAMRRGRMLEPVAIACMKEDRPNWVITHNPMPGGNWLVDRDARISATPDAFVSDPDRGFGIVQIKSVEGGVFKRKWKTEYDVVEPPLWIAIQASIEAELTGAKWAACAALVVGFGIDLHIVDIPLIPGVYDKAAEYSRAFWAKTDKGELFDPDFEKDGKLIRSL